MKIKLNAVRKIMPTFLNDSKIISHNVEMQQARAQKFVLDQIFDYKTAADIVSLKAKPYPRFTTYIQFVHWIWISRSAAEFIKSEHLDWGFF